MAHPQFSGELLDKPPALLHPNDAQSTSSSKKKSSKSAKRASVRLNPRVVKQSGAGAPRSAKKSSKKKSSSKGSKSSKGESTKTTPAVASPQPKKSIEHISKPSEEFNYPSPNREPDDDSGTQFESFPGSDEDASPVRFTRPSPSASPPIGNLCFDACEGSPSPPNSCHRGLMDLPKPSGNPLPNTSAEENIYRPKPTTAMNPFKQQMHQLLNNIMEQFPSSDEECSDADAHSPKGNDSRIGTLLAALDEAKKALSSVKSRSELHPDKIRLLSDLSFNLQEFAQP